MDTPDTNTSLFFVYAVVWALIAIYLVVLHLKISKLDKQQQRFIEDK